MPEKNPSPLSELGPDLLEELKAVAALVQKSADTGSSKEAPLAVTRILAGVSAAQWEMFASAHGLESWLAIPLKVPMAQAVSTLMATQEKLALQRDQDALTGIGNRRLFDRRLRSEIERAVRSQTELSLLLLDLDNFKSVNDTYGHACGDEVLKQLGALLARSVRPYDTAARIGGEEFALILPGIPAWRAANLGKRILETFRGTSFTCSGREFFMSFSAGISNLTMSAKPLGGSCVDLMTTADSALYQAKAQGKNQVVVFQGGRPGGARESLVRSQEKEFLFTCRDTE